jgi:hypothetical protein
MDFVTKLSSGAGVALDGAATARGAVADMEVTRTGQPTYIPGMTGEIHTIHASSTRAQVTKAGVSFGSALAIAISWSLHKSILWAIIHGIFSWFYVIYYAVTR